MHGVYSWFSSPQTEVKPSSSLTTLQKDKIGGAAQESFGSFTKDLTQTIAFLEETHRIGQAKVDPKVQKFHTHLGEI